MTGERVFTAVHIVVTGASGNVATALLRVLRRENWRVTGVARHRPDGPPYDRADWVTCDIGERGAVGRLAELFEGADAVVHLAWAIHPEREDPPMHRTNVSGTENLLAAMAKAHVPHLVAASSVAAYEAPHRWARVDENWPRQGIPASAYSRGKVVLERMLDEFEARQPEVTVARLRPCAILQHDAGSEFARWTLSPLLPKSLLGRRWLPLPWWTGLRAQVVHAADVAAAIRAIVARGAGGAFNLAAEPVLTGAQLARPFGGGPRIPVPRGPSRAGAWLGWRLGLQPLHPGWLALADQAALVDTDRARRVLGWRPEHDAHEVLAEMAAGLRTGAAVDSHPLRPLDRGPHVGRPTHQSQG
ncbi:NAD-dependent epimerase/dehydratase family protein [Kutzneria sp. NPDC051319]|uniref:NAD-dependent epimerase/dehydratase family protein n=1 Tax=Kutzneria sp. NPDC051319 TaxID=3155047 RepID=UPI00343CCB25